MLNIIYAGTPDVAVPPLDYLANSDKVRVVGVLTREDAPVGRKRVLTPSPVAQRAEELGLPIVKANRWNDEAAAAIAELNEKSDLVVTVETIKKGRTVVALHFRFKEDKQIKMTI